MVGEELGVIDGLVEVLMLGEEFGILVIGFSSEDDVDEGLTMVGNLEGDVVFDFDGLLEGLSEVSTLGGEVGRLVGFLEDVEGGLTMVGNSLGDAVCGFDGFVECVTDGAEVDCGPRCFVGCS